MLPDVQTLGEKFRESDSLTRLLRIFYRSFTALATKKLVERGYPGLGLAHIALFAALEPQGTRIHHLAERTGTTKQFAGRLVSELQTRGYLVTETDPADRRATLVKATDRGWSFLRDVYEAKNEIESDYTAILGEERMQQFVESLALLYEHHPDCFLEKPELE